MCPVPGNDPCEFAHLFPIPSRRSDVGATADTDHINTTGHILDMTWRTVAAGALVVQLSGVLDAPGVLSLRELLEERLGLSRLCRVILDLTAITRLSPEGVELLVELHRRSHIDGFVVVLVGSSRGEVERPLLGAGALPLFATRPTVRHALAGVSGAVATTRRDSGSVR